MKVLHIDTGKTWRGGQAQVNNLIRNLPDEVTSHLLTPPDSELKKRIKEYLPESQLHSHKLRGEWDLSAAWKIRKLHKKYNFDLIHAHSSHALGIAWVSSLLFNVPPYIETRRLELPIGKNWFSKKKYQGAAHHIANSISLKEVLIDCGLDKNSVSVIPSGIDLQKIQETEPNKSILLENDLDPNRPIIGNVGALSPQKDHETFIKTAEKLLKNNPEAQFIIAGEGELRGKLETLIDKKGLKDNVKLAGFVTNIFGLIKTFDLFLFTSVYEGLCGTILQAMACKIPVVSADIKGSKEILHNEKNCKVVPQKDVEEFAKQVKIFLDNPDVFNVFLPVAFETAAKYDYRQLGKQMAKLYSSVSQ